MKVKGSQVGRSFWLQWVLVNTVGLSVGLLGLLVGVVLANMIGDPYERGMLERILEQSMAGAGLGLGVGLMQWLVLRRRVSRAGWWVLAITAGLAVAGDGNYGMTVIDLGYGDLGLSFGTVLSWAVVVALGGAVTGILQWLILRRQVSRAGWWVLASIVGWGLGMAVMGAFAVVSEGLFFGLTFVGAPVGGAVMGAVTGGALVWLLRQPVPEA